MTAGDSPAPAEHRHLTDGGRHPHRTSASAPAGQPTNHPDCTPQRELPQTVLRVATDRRLLEETITRGTTTRAELADACGYSRPTVSKAVHRMVSYGLLDEVGTRQTGRRGRIATLYRPGRRAGWVLGLHITPSCIQARATGLTGDILHEQSRPFTITNGGGAAQTVNAARRMVRQLRRAGASHHDDQPAGAPLPSAAGFARDRGPLRAVGISIANAPGQPIKPLGRPGNSVGRGGLTGVASVVGELTGVPVTVDNHVNLAALAEYRAVAGGHSCAYVHVDTSLGIAVGLHIGGRLVRGAHGLAGEIGDLPGISFPTVAADVQAAAQLTDPQRAAQLLADGVSRVIIAVAAVVNPSRFLLGGPAGAHPDLLRLVRQRTHFLGTVHVEQGVLGHDAAMTGAIGAALDEARSSAILTGSPGSRTADHCGP